MLSGFGELLEAASFERKPRCLKGMIAIYEPRRKFHADHYPGEALLAAMSIVKVLRQTSSSASGHGIHHESRRCREVPSYEPIGGSPQSFFVSLLAERQATGLISGIVGCAGGLGGFFPPLVMGFVRDQYWELRVGFRDPCDARGVLLGVAARRGTRI